MTNEKVTDDEEKLLRKERACKMAKEIYPNEDEFIAFELEDFV